VNKTNNEVRHYISENYSIRVYKFKRLISAMCEILTAALLKFQVV